MTTIGRALKDAFLMGWEVWWALVLGFAISAIVQAWVPRQRPERSLGGSGVRPVALATALGVASSTCSYAAVAIAKSLFVKHASAASALALQFASTNLVVELGIVLWLLIGWQFTLAEYIGGLVLVALMTLLLRMFVSRSLEERARAARGRAPRRVRGPGVQFLLAVVPAALRAWNPRDMPDRRARPARRALPGIRTERASGCPRHCCKSA